MAALKKILIALIVLLLLAAAVICILNSEWYLEKRHKVFLVSRKIPEGFISSEEHWDQDGWQDFVDYAKFLYKDDSAFAVDPEYGKVTEADIPRLKGFFDNFRQWMKVEERLKEYDFDPSCLDAGDLFRLVEKYPNYDDYDIWFFDSQTLTLYYFHANI